MKKIYQENTNQKTGKVISVSDNRFIGKKKKITGYKENHYIKGSIH